MAIVKTSTGTIHTAHRGDKAMTELSDEEAVRIAKTANAEAEKLGIKTRYEVAAD